MIFGFIKNIKFDLLDILNFNHSIYARIMIILFIEKKN